MEPWAKNIEALTKSNETFRTVVWTGKHIQVTVMCIKPGDDVGLEAHPNVRPIPAHRKRQSPRNIRAKQRRSHQRIRR